MSSYARDLETHGVVVVPVMDDSSRRWWEDHMWAAMDADFPEYKAKGRTVQRVLGGFGALGNPSSFHAPAVRALRNKMARLVMRPLFREYADLVFGSRDGVNMEILFDRLCVRYEPFNRPTAEAWHRDIYSATKYGLRWLSHTLPDQRQDELFGGWLNLTTGLSFSWHSRGRTETPPFQAVTGLRPSHPTRSKPLDSTNAFWRSAIGRSDTRCTRTIKARSRFLPVTRSSSTKASCTPSRVDLSRIPPRYASFTVCA